MISSEEHGKKWTKLWDSVADINFDKAPSMWEFYKTLLNGYDFRGKKVIELGCGTGINTILMGMLGADITFLDRSESALNIVRNNTKKLGVKAKYIKSDIFDFDANEEYDLVHSEGVVEHFLPPRRQKILDIHARALKKGGHAIVIVPNKACPGYIVGKKLSEKFGNWRYGPEFPYTRHELERRMKRSGFSIKKQAGGEFITSCVWFFAPIFMSSSKFLKKSLKYRPGRRAKRLDQDHKIANRVGRVIGVSAVKM